jgi:hypothetical protein
MGNLPSSIPQPTVPNQVVPTQSIEVQAAASTAQINALIAQSNADLMCGPTCQAQKSLTQLENTYVNAQTNLKTAPEQLKTAKKNYFIARDGTAAHNQMVLDTVTRNAAKVVHSLQEKFDKEVAIVTELIDTYGSLLTNYHYMNDLSIEYAAENIKMAKSLKKIRGDIITNDRKTYYEQQHIDKLASWYYYLKISYIVLAAIFILLVIFKQPGIIMKLLLIVYFIFYPIFITPMIFYIIEWLKKMYNLLPKNVYKTI